MTVDAAVEEAYHRTTKQRLFMSVIDLKLDTRGNGETAEIYYLDNVTHTYWRRWDLDQILHWHPFKVKLASTPRAGLHIAASWRDGQTQDMRYGSNFMIRSAGYFVINPSNVMNAAEPLSETLKHPGEHEIADEALRHRFGWHGELARRPARTLWCVPKMTRERELAVRSAETFAGA